MTPTTSALLLGGAMTVSALSLVATGSGCQCFMNLCAQADAPEDDACCAPGTYYYSCQVELEGPSKLDYTPVTFAQCFSGADQAQEAAPGIAQAMYEARYPGAVGRSASCNVADCIMADGTGGAP